MQHDTVRLVAATAGMLIAAEAMAGSVSFSGSLQTTTPPLVVGGAPCGPGQALNATNPGNSTQTTSSTFGSFGYTNIHCVPFPPVPPFSISGGTFTFAFAGGDISGDYSAETSPTGDPLVFDVAALFAVTGGTGLFAGATGLISGIGTVDRSGASPIFTQALTGRIDAPAIPEPATWGLKILGFGAVGFALRRRTGAPQDWCAGKGTGQPHALHSTIERVIINRSNINREGA